MHLERKIFMIDEKDKLLAIVSHCGCIFVGAGLVIIPLVIYLLFKGKNEFVADHARQALKAQAIVGFISFIIVILSFFVVGFVLWPVMFIMAIGLFICSVIAGWKAFHGERYQYPLI